LNALKQQIALACILRERSGACKLRAGFVESA
jgi:hypothetical protein